MIKPTTLRNISPKGIDTKMFFKREDKKAISPIKNESITL